MALTIAEVAGIVNVGVVLCQFTFPLMVMFVLVGIAARANNAVTWSVTGRLLNGTWWPSILRTDAVATRNVSRKVLFISFYATFGLILLAVAAVLTPLGLYDSFTVADGDVEFTYVHDLTPLGTTMPDRNAYNTSRLCGWLMYKPCPGQYHGFQWFTNRTGSYVDSDSPNDYISSVMPDNLTEIFSSGRQGKLRTVATPFDLQYRSYIVKRDMEVSSVLVNDSLRWNIDEQRLRTVGNGKVYDRFILADDFVVRDGVVADMKNGGIGLRNHTVPTDARLGTEWTESLLWVEPETLCVNNNISLEFRTRIRITDNPENYIVDKGGLLAIQTGMKYPTFDYEHTQDKTELYARAYKAATLLNYNTALFLGVNATKNATFVGRRFRTLRNYEMDPGQIMVGSFDLGIPSTGLTASSTNPALNLSAKAMKSINLLTKGYGGLDVANISRIAANGGVVVGAPTKIDKDSSGRNDPGSNYSAPIFSCVTILKAYIMDVTFTINGTSGLDRLRVKTAVPRTYPNGSQPLWAIEKAADRFFVPDADLLWGLVDDKYEGDARLWTTRRDHLYLPAGKASFKLNNLVSSDSLATGVFENILAVIYAIAPTGDFGDYVGKYSQPLMQKWSDLSQRTETFPKIFSLVWTDVAINVLTSRRSQLNADFSSVTTVAQAEQQQAPSTKAVAVTQYSHVVRFRPVYAIPAILYLVCYVGVLVVAIVLRIMNRSTLTMLRSLLNQTSVGRAVLAERAENEDSNMSARIKTMGTRDWVDQYGAENIGIEKNAVYTALSSGLDDVKDSADVRAASVSSSFSGGPVRHKS